ncbi:MAG: hypothetical protein BHW33_02140 [Firmicutes bacterium CAG:137_57_8]|nr:MAG: hypothetical protein BHW33_02140 [Firmicutes bacterium CAG:137_57_8]
MAFSQKFFFIIPAFLRGFNCLFPAVPWTRFPSHVQSDQGQQRVEPQLMPHHAGLQNGAGQSGNAIEGNQPQTQGRLSLQQHQESPRYKNCAGAQHRQSVHQGDECPQKQRKLHP